MSIPLACTQRSTGGHHEPAWAAWCMGYMGYRHNAGMRNEVIQKQFRLQSVSSHAPACGCGWSAAGASQVPATQHLAQVSHRMHVRRCCCRCGEQDEICTAGGMWWWPVSCCCSHPDGAQGQQPPAQCDVPLPWPQKYLNTTSLTQSLRGRAQSLTLCKTTACSGRSQTGVCLGSKR